MKFTNTLPTQVKTQNTFWLPINYFDSDMSNSTNTVVYFDDKDDNLYLRLRTMSHTIYAAKFE